MCLGSDSIRHGSRMRTFRPSARIFFAWANTSSLSKTQVSLIYGGMAALHVVRIHFKDRYAHFFTVPDAKGRLRVGMSLAPD